VSWEYDVYAAPFYPSEYRAINLEKPMRTIVTQSRRQIDYSTYTSTFSGTDFLPQQPASYRDVDRHAIRPTSLTPLSYRPYFNDLWRLECEAKEEDNEKYALYKVSISPVNAQLEDTLWTLSIPGLRQDTPFIEMGDCLKLRQFRFTGNGIDMHFPMPMEINAHGTGYSFLYTNWTGVQYDACVYSVNRATEVVYLRVDGLASRIADYTHVPAVVNVVFPLKQPRIEIEWKALKHVSAELSKMVLRPPPDGPEYEDDEDFNAFHEKRNGRGSPLDASKKDNAPHNHWIRRILFPTEEDGLMQTRLRKIPHRELFDHAINYEQAHGVNSILINNYGTLPYLVSGPPGTGKTKTLVETAMQLFHASKFSHTLICAPSEAAADTLALRLKQYLSQDQLFRLIRPARADNEVPREIVQYCYMENDMFALPPIKKLMKYNIVVTSCQDAGILLEARLTNNDLWQFERNMLATFHPDKEPSVPSLHWNALLIDEAAQATEFDLLAAISVACPPSAYPATLAQPLFVMAGDENQLGPQTASRNPQFSTSLFARLSNRPLYKNHPLSRSHSKPSAGPPVLKKSMLPILHPPFTNLIRNYRSHPAILSVPSSLFYNDTLIPEASPPASPLRTSPLWHGRKWPVLFLPHTSPDEIERDGGGWYNVSEAHLACSLAQSFAATSAVPQADICIMSPFAAQVKLLRKIIRSPPFGLWDVNIGPLEAFQGLEKRVVILCTTRTRARFLQQDELRGLGIVHQQRKMNVALTRAKEGLCVIGSPAILRQDEHWRQWMAFCWRNGLVSDPQGLWDGEMVGSGVERVGVLERALVAKEERGEKGRVLGGAASLEEERGEYEVWTERLREVMEEEEESEEDEEGGEEEDESD
jgi:helicase MOV-10